MTRVKSGRPYPIGPSLDAGGANFALFSAHAEKVELCLFDSQGRREVERLALPENTGGVWHGYIPELESGALYGYRVHGPYAPAEGHRFNPNKLLLDPYARDIVGSLRVSAAHLGYRLGSPRGDVNPDRHDNARLMPKCRLVDETFSWGADQPPRHPWSDTVIYELHGAGYTRLLPKIDTSLRGTLTALRLPAVLDHLHRLGVTAVELLPVHTSVDDGPLLDRGLRNYWGYNTIGFFAPDRRLLGKGDEHEFKRMVAAFHAAGIEVILDVVYNHTAEGNHLGPTLAFRGIDNASYYWLKPNDRRYYDDFTGTGNSLCVANPHVLQMVADSLRYWVTVMHVDGFRFDLATTLGRGPNGFDPNGTFLATLLQDPVLSTVKLIAEPWDLGLGGYQLGHFPPGWSEWNDRYRDAMRRFWRGDGIIGEVAARLAGSADFFGHDGRHASASINFVTAHDGFVLQDLVSYTSKHNEANGEENHDGADENLSSNYGVEGPSDDPAIVECRNRQRRNFLATLLLSQGVPMLLAGDEVGNSQQGNNNAYCQDNEIGWVDWSGLGTEGKDLTDFISRLVRLRRERGLARDHFVTGAIDHEHGLKDIAWLRPDGQEMTEQDWHFPDARFFATLLTGEKDKEPVIILLNSHHEPLDFMMPAVSGITHWSMIVNTALPSGFGDRHCPVSEIHQVEPRSLVLAIGKLSLPGQPR